MIWFIQLNNIIEAGSVYVYVVIHKLRDDKDKGKHFSVAISLQIDFPSDITIGSGIMPTMVDLVSNGSLLLHKTIKKSNEVSPS